MNACSTYCLLVLCLSLSSCGDCVQQVTGVVVNQDSHQAVSGVSIRRAGSNNASGYTLRSDSLGRFLYRGISGGLFHCPGPRLQFSKEGYRTVEYKFRSFQRADTVYLQALKQPKFLSETDFEQQERE